MTEIERAKRIHHHMYETCEGIEEHAERIVALEELASNLWHLLYSGLFKSKEVPWYELEEAYDRMKELGIEVKL